MTAVLQIVGVAFRIDGLILSLPRPARHPNIAYACEDLGIPVGKTKDQGFLLSDGSFVDRRQALELATTNGQCACPSIPSQLFSEDLW